MVQPTIHGLAIEQVAVVIAVDHEPEIRLDHVEEKVEVDKTLRVGIDFDLESGESQPGAHPFQVELNLGQRKPAWIPGPRELSNQTSICVVLMLIRIQECAPHPAQQAGDLRVIGEGSCATEGN